MSGGHGGDHESDEGDPVFGFSDGESAEGRKKEEVEAGDAKQGSEDRRFGSPGRGHKKHQQQQHQGDGSRIDVAAENFENSSSCPDNNNRYDVSEELLIGGGFQHAPIVSLLA